MPKPLLFADNRSPSERFDPSTVRANDPSYIPGYSEIVQANDIERADELAFMQAHAGTSKKRKEDWYKVIGQAPRELDCELSWQRVVSPNGGTSYSADVQLMNAAREGWRVATAEDLQSRGFGMPPTAHVDADGKIRRLDTALYIRDGEVARAWERYRAEEAARAEGSPLPKTLGEGKYATETIFEQERQKAEG